MSELYVAIAAVLVAGVTVAVPAVDADGPSFAFHWFPRLRPLPVHRAGRAALPSSPRKFSARPSHKTEEGRAQISKTRERSGRQDVPEQRGPRFLLGGWRGVLAERTPPNREQGQAGIELRDRPGCGATARRCSRIRLQTFDRLSTGGIRSTHH